MAASSSSVNPTPLAHTNDQGEGHPRGEVRSNFLLGINVVQVATTSLLSGEIHPEYRMFRLKVSKSYVLLLQKYPSECNKLRIRGFENPSRFSGLVRSAARVHIIRQSQTTTQTWTPEQKVGCVG
ncbi:hypothetical protein TNCV_3239811 [Trichonephila clavipes]|nr:hypothetical protein TNCV_3239811 [Trichonephila clavipes]